MDRQQGTYALSMFMPVTTTTLNNSHFSLPEIHLWCHRLEWRPALTRRRQRRCRACGRSSDWAKTPGWGSCPILPAWSPVCWCGAVGWKLGTPETVAHFFYPSQLLSFYMTDPYSTSIKALFVQPWGRGQEAVTFVMIPDDRGFESVRQLNL